jgi:hypothetical protein
MEGTETKRVVRTFWAWQEEREEKWLADMSKKGWHLKRVGFFNYTFEKGQPADYIYRFDFKVMGKDDLEDYKSMFEDAGWKCIGNFSSWFYFRADSNQDPDRELYSNNRSKMEKYKRLLIFLAIVTGPAMMYALPNLYMRVIDMASDSVLNDPVVFNIYLSFVIILTIVEMWAVYGIIRIALIINRLKRDIRE